MIRPRSDHPSVTRRPRPSYLLGVSSHHDPRSRRRYALRRSLSFLAAAALPLGCGGGGGDTTPDANGPCATSRDSCAGDRICVAGACELAFDRLYEIGNVVVDTPRSDAHGGDWDPSGGAPDLFVAILHNGSRIGVSFTSRDTFSATFSGPFPPIFLPEGNSIAIEVWDEDASEDGGADTRMFTCEAPTIDAAMLRQRVFRCEDGGFSVRAEINPR